MATEPTPPTAELTDEIEAALSAHATTCFLRGLYGEVREGRLEETECNLRQAIHAALDERDTALVEQYSDGFDEGYGHYLKLRERAERLRTRFVAHWHPRASIADKEDWAGLDPGDLADDLRPRE